MKEAAKIAFWMIVFIVVLVAIYVAGGSEGLDLMKEVSGP